MLRILCVSLCSLVAVAACSDPPVADHDAAMADASGDTGVEFDDASTDGSSDPPDSATTDHGSDTADAWDGGPDHLPPSQPGRHEVTVVDTRQIIPGPGLPEETPAQNANNNLDVVRYDGRVYLAWRAAPDHYASEDARIHVISSDDETTWTHETTVSRNRDVREPRFLPLENRLFLYVTELGTNALAFEPNDVLAVQRNPGGTWQAPVSLGLEDTVLWRARLEQETPYLLYYVGGGSIFGDMSPIDVHLDTTADGTTLTPVSEENAPILSGGVSETDFALNADGDLVGVSRNESGDDEGFGSKVCTAPASDITDWTCAPDRRKFDSPLMFFYDGEYYLIARRNVTPSGNFDLGRDDLNRVEQFVLYQREYKVARKRCAVWRWEPTDETFVFIVDLPSRGDTCFPALISGSEPGEFIVYNYSSPIDGDDLSWTAGQEGETRIYRHVLQLE
jgi:hypothetical protein